MWNAAGERAVSLGSKALDRGYSFGKGMHHLFRSVDRFTSDGLDNRRLTRKRNSRTNNMRKKDDMIIIVLDREFYTLGEEVVGTVIILVKKAVKLSAALLNFTGREMIHWEEKTEKGNEVEQEELVYFDQVVSLWESAFPEEVPFLGDSPGPDYEGEKEYETHNFHQAFNESGDAYDQEVKDTSSGSEHSQFPLKEVMIEGEYEFTFNFQLPSDLPDSYFWNDKNKIVYLVTCVLFGPSGIRKKTEEIKIHKNISLIENLRLICPNIYYTHTYIAPGDKKIEVQIDIPNSVFELGQTEQLTLVISDKKIFKWIQVNIIQTLLTQKDLFAYVRERKFTIISSGMNPLTGEWEGEGGTESIQSLHFFTIPSQDQLEPTITSKMIRNTYKLEVRFFSKKSSEGFLSRETKEDYLVEFPITLVRPSEPSK